MLMMLCEFLAKLLVFVSPTLAQQAEQCPSSQNRRTILFDSYSEPEKFTKYTPPIVRAHYSAPCIKCCCK